MDLLKILVFVKKKAKKSYHGGWEDVPTQDHWTHIVEEI